MDPLVAYSAPQIHSNLRPVPLYMMLTRFVSWVTHKCVGGVNKESILVRLTVIYYIASRVNLGFSSGP